MLNRNRNFKERQTLDYLWLLNENRVSVCMPSWREMRVSESCSGEGRQSRFSSCSGAPIRINFTRDNGSRGAFTNDDVISLQAARGSYISRRNIKLRTPPGPRLAGRLF